MLTGSDMSHGEIGKSGNVRVFAFACGWLSAEASTVLSRASGWIDFPIPAYLIEHPKGRLLFDAGMHPELQTDPRKRLGPWGNLFRINYRAGEDIAGHLRRLNIDPADIDLVAASHLHFTHAGGLELLPNARIVVQRKEWAAAHREDLIKRNNYIPADYDHGHLIRTVEGEHDFFGDGAVVSFPSFGHTPGHQSMKVRLASGQIVLTSDACYFRETLDRLHLPRIVYDRSEMLSSLLKFRELRRSGSRIFYGHDAEFWKTIPKAPIPIR